MCATVCPTGAIRYVYPSLEDTLNRIRQVLQEYQMAGGEQAIIGFISEEDFANVVEWPDNVIPIILEELASVGLDVWLSTLVYGASSILLLEAGSVHAVVETALKKQLGVLKSLLSGMNYSPEVIQYCNIDVLEGIELAVMPEFNVAKFAGTNRKREVLFFALNHLASQARVLVESIPASIDLPEAAPFGQLLVDGNKCTLCMGCTSVCPAKALHAGNDIPRLSFIEENCVQCGLCEVACPEQAITLAPRLLTDKAQRCLTVTLNEEPPFLCISCSKPFATQSLIDTILGKLSEHAMFQSDRAKKRLMMCEDCRVVDVVQDTQAMQDQALNKKF